MKKFGDSWYEDSHKYWQETSATMEGMLGGLTMVHEPDIQGSSIFLRKVLGDRHLGHACDCGAGIGRVSRYLLTPLFERIDLVESNQEFLQTAQDILSKVEEGKEYRFILKGLQDFTPLAQEYDLIWCQWVLLYLTDQDLVEFLRKCQRALRPGGVICIKENLTRKEDYVVDEEDSSVTRSDRLYRKLFEEAGFRVRLEQLQSDFPRGLYPVKMYCLDPVDSGQK